jgi:uncharacterized membrane protein YedE/YeeE
MNSGFRNLLGRRDTTKFKAFSLAIALQMLILPLLAHLGIIHLEAAAFYPVGATVGGFLFGLAMNWGGGCAAGVWYKLGAGSIGALVSTFSLTFGYIVAESGALRAIRLLIQTPYPVNTLPNVLHISFWWTAIPVASVILILLMRNWKTDQQKTWMKTGTAVGFIGIIGWITSSYAGRSYGMAIMPGTKQGFDLLSSARVIASTWDFFFVLGIPLGGFLSARRSGEFKWSNITGASIWKNIGGGLLLGISASFAGGCTVGHGLTGIPLLSLAGIVFIVFAIVGSWTGVALFQKAKAVPKNADMAVVV